MRDTTWDEPKPRLLNGSHFVPNAAAAIVVTVVAARRHQGAQRPIADLWGGVSVSGSNVGGARRGQGGRMGGRTVGCAQLSDTLWGRSPLCKACVVLQEEHGRSVHGPVVHLIPGTRVSARYSVWWLSSVSA